MKLIKDLWNGDVSLVITYWLYGVVFVNVFTIVLTYILETTPLADMLSAILMFVVLLLAVYIHMAVSIWNSSAKYIADKKSESKSTFWGYAARVVLVLGLLRGIAEIMREFGF